MLKTNYTYYEMITEINQLPQK